MSVIVGESAIIQHIMFVSGSLGAGNIGFLEQVSGPLCHLPGLYSILNLNFRVFLSNYKVVDCLLI